MNIDSNEAWEIFMRLCEEFPELYDKYAEKAEKETNDHKSDFEITEEDKKRALEKLRERNRKTGLS